MNNREILEHALNDLDEVDMMDGDVVLDALAPAVEKIVVAAYERAAQEIELGIKAVGAGEGSTIHALLSAQANAIRNLPK